MVKMQNQTMGIPATQSPKETHCPILRPNPQKKVHCLRSASVLVCFSYSVREKVDCANEF